MIDLESLERFRRPPIPITKESHQARNKECPDQSRIQENCKGDAKSHSFDRGNTAMILAVVFAAFVISGVTSIKMMGFGVAFAILLDATLIRAFLVPALMRLFGEWNWWAPRALKRFQINH